MRAPTEMPQLRESITEPEAGEEKANATDKSCRDNFAGVENFLSESRNFYWKSREISAEEKYKKGLKSIVFSANDL